MGHTETVMVRTESADYCPEWRPIAICEAASQVNRNVEVARRVPSSADTSDKLSSSPAPRDSKRPGPSAGK